MGYGVPCKHCRLQESDHFAGGGDLSDKNCPGYEPLSAKREAKLALEEERTWSQGENQAPGRDRTTLNQERFGLNPPPKIVTELPILILTSDAIYRGGVNSRAVRPCRTALFFYDVIILSVSNLFSETQTLLISPTKKKEPVIRTISSS